MLKAVWSFIAPIIVILYLFAGGCMLAMAAMKVLGFTMMDFWAFPIFVAFLSLGIVAIVEFYFHR